MGGFFMQERAKRSSFERIQEEVGRSSQQDFLGGWVDLSDPFLSADKPPNARLGANGWCR